MFEITFHFYLKKNAENEFFDWLKGQNLKEINALLPEGIQVLGLVTPLAGTEGKLEARLQMDDLNSIGKMHIASSKPGFLATLQSLTDKSRDVETLLVNKLL